MTVCCEDEVVAEEEEGATEAAEDADVACTAEAAPYNGWGCGRARTCNETGNRLATINRRPLLPAGNTDLG